TRVALRGILVALGWPATVCLATPAEGANCVIEGVGGSGARTTQRHRVLTPDPGHQPHSRVRGSRPNPSTSERLIMRSTARTTTAGRAGRALIGLGTAAGFVLLAPAQAWALP